MNKKITSFIITASLLVPASGLWLWADPITPPAPNGTVSSAPAKPVKKHPMHHSMHHKTMKKSASSATTLTGKSK